ncbi:MAG: hypothetical protein KA352_14565 [Flavobacteriales bacterium]|nr:hypothetical protein [Flavobacteriales bacterium]
MRNATLLLFVLFGHQAIHAQAGTLDLSFSGDGLHVWDVMSWDDRLSAVVVQPDGKTVGAGWVDDGNTSTILVQRLMPDGTPDVSFGSGGLVTTGAIDHSYRAYAVGVQSTGKIVVAGLAYDLNLDGNVILVRYLADGTLDLTFGNGGITSSDLNGGPAFQAAWSLGVMADDRLVVVGEESANGLVCARFTADGFLDPSFGVNGVALTGVGFSTGLCLHLNADGSVFAGGYRLDGDSDWMLARFRPDGVLDPTFGTGGVATLDLAGGDTEMMRGVSVLDDGRIAACGYRSFQGLDDEPAVALFEPNGDPHLAFGTGGLVLLPFTAPQWGQAWSIIAQPDDKLLVAGFRAEPGIPANNDFFLYRLLDDGSFDASFAGGGQVYTDVSGSYDRAYAMALAPSGAIVLGGSGTGGLTSTAYARYVNDISTSVPVEMTSTSLRIYPTPATDHVMVEFEHEGNTRVKCTLHSSDGRRVLASDLISTSPGTHPYIIELPPLIAAGRYVLEFSSAERTLRGAVMVMER